MNNPNIIAHRSVERIETEKASYAYMDKIGGNSELEDAKIICIGEHHSDILAGIQMTDFINDVANDGDVLLLEGVPANQQVDLKNSFQTDNITKNVHAIGWDNIELRDKAAKNVKVLMAVQCQITSMRVEDGESMLKRLQLEDRFQELYKSNMELAINERNKSLEQTIDNAQKEYPDKRIFVYAGTKHFTNDEQLIEKLGTESFIVLKPKGEQVSKEESFKRTQAYFS